MQAQARVYEYVSVSGYAYVYIRTSARTCQRVHVSKLPRVVRVGSGGRALPALA